jgi:acetylornithine deacetylase/succinyl-diaminopimelate desuccinylase-like protein
MARGWFPLRAGRRATRAAALATLAAFASLGAGPPPASGSPEADGRRALDLLQELALIPTQSGDREAVARGAEWLEERFRRLGFRTQRLEEPGRNAMVFADLPAWPEDAQAPVVLFYAHFDTQPTGPAQDWGSTDGAPFRPRLLSGRWDDPDVRPLTASALDAGAWASARLYGRGVADDKAPIAMHLVALEDYAARKRRPVHLKFLLDGEEEAGSPDIGGALRRHAALLRADLLVLCDGPRDPLDRPAVALGTRGDMHARLRVRTAGSSAHSGNYSLVPNAAFRLSRLLATMQDASGRVTVEGFAQGAVPPTVDERRVLKEASRAEEAIGAELGVERFDGDPSLPYFERLLFHPSLIVNQVTAGRPGNQVPVVAEAILEVRLVTRQDPRQVFDALRRHVVRHEPGADLEYMDGVAAARMDPSDPGVAWGLAAMKRALGDGLLVYPTLGGTLPLLSDFGEARFRYVQLPLVNYDNNQHVANENIRVAMLPAGVATLRALYEALAASPPPAGPDRITPARSPS